MSGSQLEPTTLNYKHVPQHNGRSQVMVPQLSPPAKQAYRRLSRLAGTNGQQLVALQCLLSWLKLDESGSGDALMSPGAFWTTQVI